MKKMMMGTLLAGALFLVSCGGGKESAASISKKWCELTAAMKNATTEADHDAARDKRKAYEKEIEAKYKNDEAFMKELKELTRKCD